MNMSNRTKKSGEAGKRVERQNLNQKQMTKHKGEDRDNITYVLSMPRHQGYWEMSFNAADEKQITSFSLYQAGKF